MSELKITVSDTGVVKVFVDDQQIGLVQELTVRASTDRPAPAVEVRFPSKEVMSASSTMPKAHEEYLELLRRIPSVVLMSGDEPSGPDSDIIQFFLDVGRDGGGRTLTQVMQQDDSWLERTHDYVQWILPTRRKSKYEPDAPVLTDRDVQVFAVRRDLREAYSFGVARMKRFLQLDQMQPSWVRRRDHNHKRISRMIESLMDLGFEERANRVLDQVLRIDSMSPDVVDREAVEHWRKACGR